MLLTVMHACVCVCVCCVCEMQELVESSIEVVTPSGRVVKIDGVKRCVSMCVKDVRNGVVC